MQSFVKKNREKVEAGKLLLILAGPTLACSHVTGLHTKLSKVCGHC